MNLITTQLQGPQPVTQVVRDIVRRGLIVGPVILIIGGAIWGLEGVASVGYALVLVLLNFWLSSALISYSAKISLGLLMVSVMFGFLLRLGMIFIAFWLTKDLAWMSVVAFGITIVIMHLGLLIWELKYISASMAYPGLKPKKDNKGKNKRLSLKKVRIKNKDA